MKSSIRLEKQSKSRKTTKLFSYRVYLSVQCVLLTFIKSIADLVSILQINE